MPTAIETPTSSWVSATSAAVISHAKGKKTPSQSPLSLHELSNSDVIPVLRAIAFGTAPARPHLQRLHAGIEGAALSDEVRRRLWKRVTVAMYAFHIGDPAAREVSRAVYAMKRHVQVFRVFVYCN